MGPGIHPPENTHGPGPRDCGDCASSRGTKPIAHTDALDEPISHLCLECYASWVGSLPHEAIGEPDCLICGQDGEYATTREIPTLTERTMIVEGCLRFCEDHIHEFAPVAIGAD